MRQYRVLVWDNDEEYEDQVTYFVDVSELTESEVFYLTGYLVRSEGRGHVVAYGTVHWFEERPPAPLVDFLTNCTEWTCSEYLTRVDVSWAGKIDVNAWCESVREAWKRTLTDLAAEPAVVHVLDRGQALCGAPGIPEDHRWVPLSEKEKATCEGCREKSG